jgi:hypothetical protein
VEVQAFDAVVHEVQVAVTTHVANEGEEPTRRLAAVVR